MINLLPPEEKRKSLLEKKKKILIILGCLISFFFFCVILILLIIKFYFSNQLAIQKISIEEKKQTFEGSELKNLQEKIDSFNSILGKLASFYEQRTIFSDILAEISKTIYEGIYLNNFSASIVIPTEGKPYIDIMLSGFAKNRENLSNFRGNLEGVDKFSDVYFPPSNWVKPTDINFSVSFKIYK